MTKKIEFSLKGLFDVNKDRRKVKKLVEGKNFDFMIMSLICLDAIILGMMTSDVLNLYFEPGLFILDRLFMGIFIIEMILKIFAFRKSFFKSGWNVFDFTIVAVSSVPFASYFIILRTFRLFRLLKYINKFSRLKSLINTFIALLPNFVSMVAVFSVFFYVFAIIAVSLYGDIFVEFGSIGSALFALLQVFTLDGWATTIARPVMSIFPNSWLFFASFVLISFLIMVSFILSAFIDLINKNAKKKA